MEEEILKLILVEMREMKGDVSELKTDMKEVKGRIANLETDMTEVKDRVTNLESDMSEVKSDIVELKTDMSEVKSDMVEVKTTLQETKELSEFNKETSDSIKNVVTSHYMEFKKFVKSNATQHNLYNAKLLKYNKKN